MRTKVLFVCVHNSARSQMAEAYLNSLGGDKFEADSAGFEPTAINPIVVQVMKGDGLDLSANETQSVFELVRQSKFYGIIVTVCDRAREKECPTFPGVQKNLHWDLENPEDFVGTEDEILGQVRILRDKIKELIQTFIEKNA